MTESTKPRRFAIGVVDDDARVLDSLEELLASAEHTVARFLSAGAFLAAKGFERVDCLISDIGMPGISGWNLLQIAKAHHPEFPVILITGREGELSRFSTEQLGVRYIFTKPFGGPELLAAIHSLLLSGEEPPSQS